MSRHFLTVMAPQRNPYGLLLKSTDFVESLSIYWKLVVLSAAALSSLQKLLSTGDNEWTGSALEILSPNELKTETSARAGTFAFSNGAMVIVHAAI